MKTIPAPHWASPFLLTACACLVLFVLRDASGALSPPVRLEDATNMLSFYWKDSDPSKLLREYAGYLSLGPNLVGYIAGNLPGLLTIYVLHWVPLIMAACAFASIQLRDVEILGMSHCEKAIVVIALVLMPMGNYALITNTTYMLWSMLIMSTILVLFWTPRASFRAVVLLFFLALTSMSHPLFVLLLPILCIRIFFAKSRFERVGFAAVLIIAVVYLLLVVDFSGSQKGARDGLIALIIDSIRMFATRSVTEPLISSSVRLDLVQKGNLEATILFGLLVILAGGILIWLGRARLTRRQIWQIGALFLMAGLFAAAATATGRVKIDHFGGQRYIYPSAFLVLLILFWGLLNLFKAVPGKMRIAGYALLAVWIVAINDADKYYYRSKEHDRAATRQVVSQAETLSKSGTPYCVQYDRRKWAIRLSENWPDDKPCQTVID